MDFGTLLSVAQKNEINKQSVACYQTKFTPPKKQNKQSKTLSDNIKKFLARKEEEERRKVLEEKKKRDNLLALRDHKAQSRINKHLKVCKAANKSVIADAIDNENTAVTIAGYINRSNTIPCFLIQNGRGTISRIYTTEDANGMIKVLLNQMKMIMDMFPRRHLHFIIS